MTSRTSYEGGSKDRHVRSDAGGNHKRSGRTGGMTDSIREFGRKTGMTEPEEVGADIALFGAAGSVLLAWYLFYGRGKRDHGLFVGLWPPTILAFASYLRGKAMAKRMEEMRGGRNTTSDR